MGVREGKDEHRRGDRERKERKRKRGGEGKHTFRWTERGKEKKSDID